MMFLFADRTLPQNSLFVSEDFVFFAIIYGFELVVSFEVVNLLAF